MKFNEAFDASPGSSSADLRITSPTRAKRSYIFGSGSDRKGTFRSTVQTRRQAMDDADLDNVLPAMKDAFDYVVALASAASSSLGNRLRAQLNSAMRIASTQIEAEKKRQS